MIIKAINETKKKREKGAKQEHTSGAKGTVGSLNMGGKKREGSVWNLCRRYCVYHCRTDSPLGSGTNNIVNKPTVKYNYTS